MAFVTDDKYMRRAIELARHGELDASPNPMVGAVIVSPEGRVIGEGWHRRCGEGHAEVNAVASVTESDRCLLGKSTMYVTLEPCSHYGKTPPCAEMIVREGIPRVVIGCTDPFAKVSGRGIAMLREAGVEVVTGVMEEECKALNRKFMTAHRLHRPYISLKWAQSADGFIDGIISTPLTSMLVHRLRGMHDAILIGSGTAIIDNPSLDTRLYAGHSPQRVVLDRRGRTKGMPLKLNEDENTIIMSDYAGLSEVLTRLYDNGITSVLVEGGAEVHQSFINENLWDEIRIEISPETVESFPGKIKGMVKAPSLVGLSIVPTYESVDGHLIITYRK